jgi:Methyladenine glycosylase
MTIPTSDEQLPARTAESDAMSRDLLCRGFAFVGSTICYAFMQAVGRVNDHATDCFRYEEIVRSARPARHKIAEPGGRAPVDAPSHSTRTTQR